MLRTGLLGKAVERAGLLSSALPAQKPGAPIDPGPVRWLVDRLADQHAASLLRVVRTMDQALNNTSLVLLFEAAGRRLLFPGDAQIENWSWALHSQEAEELRPPSPAWMSTRSATTGAETRHPGPCCRCGGNPARRPRRWWR